MKEVYDKVALITGGASGIGLGMARVFLRNEQNLARRTASSAWLDPLMVGEMVLDAIKQNKLFVITHNEFRAGAELRFKAILKGFPEGEPSEENIKALGFPAVNPIYAEILESDF